MTEQPKTREELYERIRTSSKEDFIQEDMIRLGFWSAGRQIEVDPPEESARRQELAEQISELLKRNRHLNNEDALLRELRRKRLHESRQKQKETKARREAERKARAQEWQEKQQQDIVYLGAGYSAGLNQQTSDEARLQQNQLPVLHTPHDLAQAMQVSIGTLRFLAFSRKTSTRSHYIHFQVPKKTGGTRLISAPMARLKSAQTWILENLLDKLILHPQAHGFRPKHSIVSNARPHVGAEVIINLDLKDFFPSITYPRIKGLFRSLGYSESIATILALLCTAADVTPVSLDGQTYFVSQGERHLPQGAPSSPALTNLLCRRLDRRLSALAQKYGFTYTRYADDLTFSASGKNLQQICNILKQSQSIVSHEGFQVNPDKTRVIRRSRQQEVTGIVVNQKPNIDRKTLKKFRATLYQIEKDGPAGKRWGSSPDVIASIQGFAHFVAMVDPEKGAVLREQVQRIISKYGWQNPHKAKLKPEQTPTQEKSKNIVSSTVERLKKWWQPRSG